MKRPIRTLGVLLAVTVIPALVLAADHGDSPAAMIEPSADITDLYAWMSADATKLNLVMGVYSDAGQDATFSDVVTYVFTVTSWEGYGAEADPDLTRVVCKFLDDGVKVECWLGDEYAVGDPSAPEGIVSDNGGLRVFAGRRDDPFFLEYTGFNNTVNAAVDAVATGAVTEFNRTCPVLTPEQATGLQGLLTSGDDGAPASNTFAGQSVLALVVQVDKALVNSGGPVLGVSASTHQPPPSNDADSTGGSY
jgi:hypothetical protein